MTLKNKKEKLATLVNRINYQGSINTYFKMYAGITDFDKVMQLETQVIEPLEKIQATHDKKLQQFQADIEKDKSKEAEINKAYFDMLQAEVEFKLAVVSQDKIKEAGFNVFQYRLVKDYVVQKGT